MVIKQRYKIKWWASFSVPKLIQEMAIQEWLHKRDYKTIKLEELLPKQKLFFSQRAHSSALLAIAKTKEEYLGIMQ